MRCTSIVSAYKCRDWLDGRITNLLEQSEVPSIIAIAQIGSEEESILKRFGVSYIPTYNIPTIYEAWNMMIEKVTTPYINIANSDDRLSKFAIEEMCNELDKGYDLVYPEYNIVFDLSGDVVGKLNNIGPCPTYRTDLHQRYGGYPEDYLIAGDYWFWLKLEHFGAKMKQIEKPLATFWDRSKNPEIENNAEYKYKNRTIWETAKAQEYWRENAD